MLMLIVMHYSLGVLQVGTVHDIHGRPHSITASHEGQQQACPMEDVITRAMSLESMWFPFFFTRAMGFYQKGRAMFRSVTAYLSHRMHQLFSVFTLYKMYIVHMWQIRQCSVIANAVSACGQGVYGVSDWQAVTSCFCWRGLLRHK